MQAASTGIIFMVDLSLTIHTYASTSDIVRKVKHNRPRIPL